LTGQSEGLDRKPSDWYGRVKNKPASAEGRPSRNLLGLGQKWLKCPLRERATCPNDPGKWRREERSFQEKNGMESKGDM